MRKKPNFAFLYPAHVVSSKYREDLALQFVLQQWC